MFGTGGNIGTEIVAEPQRLTKILADAAAKKPLLFLIDEAHTFDSEQARSFFNAVQSARSEEAPIGMILAGTPDLRDRMRNYDATFVDRSEWVHVGLLPEPSDAASAIRKPLEDVGWIIGEEALAKVVDQTDLYPYFIQIYGEELWGRVRDRTGPDRVVTLADVDAVLERVQSRRNGYYEGRHREIQGEGLLAIARELARGFNVSGALSESDLNRILEDSFRKESDPNTQTSLQPLKCGSPMEVGVRLKHFGFMVFESDSGTWKPGIPSLTRYLTDPPGPRQAEMPKPSSGLPEP